jgi:competence protein ComEC
MFDLRKIPISRVLVPFSGGVLIGMKLNSGIQLSEVLLLQIFLWILVLLIFRRQSQKPGWLPWLSSPLLFLILFFAGTGSGIYSRPADPDLPVDRLVVARGELTGAPGPGNFALGFDLQLHVLFSEDTVCRVETVLKAYMGMPEDSVLPEVGETWQFRGKLVPIRNSGNPGSPDYRSILGRKNCWYRFYIDEGAEPVRCNRELIRKGRNLNPALIRKSVSDHWHGGPEEVSLLNAVCLGNRSLLSEDMRQAYSDAGGMHLLAVSGLHVGLIWWVLQYMTGWLNLIFRKGKQQVILVVGLLWFYAFLTGFSSSVCRAVTMFSFFSASRIMGDRVHPLNAILVSAFLLVVTDPLKLTDVGFQLSYAAITGIITLHPLCMKLIRMKNRMLRWLWEATSVSLAAQLSTAPLVIFYFHQLPLYSLLTSLIAIPMLSLLIAIFVCSVPFVTAGVLERFFNFLLVGLAGLMNRFMEKISDLPGAVLSDLHLDRETLLLWCLIFLLILMTLHGNRRFSRYLLMVLISLSLLWNTRSAFIRRSSSSLLITHFRGASMLVSQEGERVDHYCWYRDSTSFEYMEAYRESCWSRRTFKNHVYSLGEKTGLTGKISTCKQLAEGVWMLGGKHYRGLVLTPGLRKQEWDLVYGDTLNNGPVLPDFILLSCEPPVDALLKSGLNGEVELVIDGSNRSWYKERIMKEGDRIYLTDSLGAYVKRW